MVIGPIISTFEQKSNWQNAKSFTYILLSSQYLIRLAEMTGKRRKLGVPGEIELLWGPEI